MVVMWNPNFFIVHVIKCTSQLIHYLIQPRNGSRKYYGTFIYAINDAGSRKQLWTNLKLLNQDDVAWVWKRDFNCVLHMKDKLGAPARADEFGDFEECVWISVIWMI